MKKLDGIIQETEPFKLIKTDPTQAKEIIKNLVVNLYTIARMLYPLMPETNIELKKLIKDFKMPEQPLFLRK